MAAKDWTRVNIAREDLDMLKEMVAALNEREADRMDKTNVTRFHHGLIKAEYKKFKEARGESI